MSNPFEICLFPYTDRKYKNNMPRKSRSLLYFTLKLELHAMSSLKEPLPHSYRRQKNCCLWIISITPFPRSDELIQTWWATSSLQKLYCRVESWDFKKVPLSVLCSALRLMWTEQLHFNKKNNIQYNFSYFNPTFTSFETKLKTAF